jgi:hypothetical protein
LSLAPSAAWSQGPPDLIFKDGFEGCTTADSCPGTDTECQTRTCTAGACGFDFAPAGTPTSTQTLGDCQRNECDGSGHTISALDDTDLPDDGLQCTDDLCFAGTPVHPPKLLGTLCDQSGGSVCDGQGACVQCNVPGDCPGTDTTCLTRTCGANACGALLAPPETPCTEDGGTHCDGAGHCVP